MRIPALLVVLALSLAGCAEPDGPVAGPPVTTGPTAPAPTDTARTTTPSGTASPTVPSGPVRLGLETVAEGLDQPLVATAPSGDDRLFIAERPGTIRIVRDGQLSEAPFLDITGRTRTGGEFGLLGLAFHPSYPDDPRFFVHHSAADDGATTVAEYRMSDDDPDRADPDSGRILLTVPQPASNHNGGTIAFGPDGYLFIGLGDGGGGGDTYDNGQDPSTLLGTLLRIDVDGTSGDRPYAIPEDNPFADGSGGAPEVWAHGLRNPYRFSFDGGSLYVADVGQSDREEVNVEPAGDGGLNYGWPIMEGTDCFRSGSCDRSGLTLPVVEYSHGEGDVCGVIGGHVHRGSSGALNGTYFYGDLCAAWVRTFRYVDGQVVDHQDRTRELGLDPGSGGYQLLSFGRDGNGEVYVLTASAVHRIVAR